MNTNINKIKITRTWLLEMIKDLSTAELNEIPSGFNNNIIWNVIHLLAAQQGICYVRAGLPVVVDEQYFNGYKPGTKPEAYIDDTEIATIKLLLFSSLDKLEADLEKNIFTDYTAWATRYGVEMNNIENAIAFLPFHEGLHTGYVMALKRVIVNSR